jgi:hypothetical protein
LLHGRREVSGNLRERSQHQIPDRVPLESATLLESMLQQLLEGGIRRRNRREAVPNVARRQDTELLSQPPGAAPVVGYRDDG